MIIRHSGNVLEPSFEKWGKGIVSGHLPGPARFPNPITALLLSPSSGHATEHTPLIEFLFFLTIFLEA